MTGTPEHWTDQLSEYVDGELDPPTRATIDAHLATCAECRATRDALTRVIARARRVPYREPARDLWTSVEAGIDALRITPIAPAPRRRLVTLPVGRLVAAVAAVAIIAAGVTWMLSSTRSVPPLAAVPDSAPAKTGGPVTSPASLAVASYRDAAADLERVLEAGRSTLRPETMRVIEENLRTIDTAIAQADSALRRDPGSDYLNQYLAATMQRKLKLLRRAVDITAARS